MERSDLMLQIEVVDTIFGEVTTVPPLHAVVFDAIRGRQAAVREVTAQKIGMFMGPNLSPFQIFESAYARVWLGIVGQPYTYFHAPSHVASPLFEEALHAVLEVKEFGMTFDDKGGELSYLRVVSAHAYLDDVAPRGPLQRFRDLLLSVVGARR